MGNERRQRDPVRHGRVGGDAPCGDWLVDQDLADEHPDVGWVCVGENWTVDRINGIMKSPLWASTAIIFTMDDFGGWYDHVPPPRQYGCDAQQPYGLGFRLPLHHHLAVRQTGVHLLGAGRAGEHPEVHRAGLRRHADADDLDPAAQDKQANDLFDAFDFNQTPLSPLVLQERTCPL